MYGSHIYKFGEKGCGLRAAHANSVQDYTKLRDKCLQSGELFVDTTFPANQSSINYSSKKGSELIWKRPKDLVESPQFISEGASRFDVMQGELGDCWFLAAIANLTMNEKLFCKVVPHDQVLFGPKYAGIIRFRFWQYGKWIEVVIDDLLPTRNGHLVFMHSKDTTEFWSALIEKAYAKLHGCYESLKGGTTTEALTDFTGGLTEFFDIQTSECPPNLFQIMMKAYNRSSFMGCSIDALSSQQMESELPNGLIKGHAYSITAIRSVQLKTSRVQGKIPLVRVRNPWGNEAEWNGAWSDKSREWTVISEDEKKELQLNFDNDGEFWMSFQDFKNNFTRLEICNLSPEPLGEEIGKQWEATLFDGNWIAGVSAGGCRNHLDTYALNPQFIIELVDYDEDDDDDKCTFMVSLMQKNRRAIRKMGLDTLTIGFAIYEVKEGGTVGSGDMPVAVKGYKTAKVLSTEYFKYNASVARSPNFINLREISGRYRMKPGTYAIIPSTFDPNEEGDFLLRVFSEKAPAMSAEADEEVALIDEKPDNNLFNDMPENLPTEEVKEVAKPKEPESPEQNSVDTETILKLLTTCWTIFNTKQATDQETIGARNISKTESSANAFFEKIAGEDMEVDAVELNTVLNRVLKKEFKFDGFTLDSCRSMVAMMDDDKSGKLGIDEFATLWRYIRRWSDIFRRHDADKSGTINTNELKAALNESGIMVSRHILAILVQRYAEIKSNKKDVKVERSMNFDSFVHCCIKLKICISTWNNQKKKNHSVNPAFSLDEWIENFMYS